MNDSIIGTEFLPNVHIEKINFQPTATSNKVEMMFTLYDYFPNSTWSRDELFRQNLSVCLVFSQNDKVIEDLNSGAALINDPAIFAKSVVEIIPFSSFNSSIKVSLRGKTYTKFTYTILLDEERDNTKELFAYVASMISLSDFSSNESMDLSHIPENALIGSIKAEKIFPNNDARGYGKRRASASSSSRGG